MRGSGGKVAATFFPAARATASTCAAPSAVVKGYSSSLERAAATLKQVRDLGVRLHIDDFGTGYASMTYVRRLPVNGLKIDRSFVAGLGDSTDDAAIVTAMLALARATDLTVTAEGVESQQQADLLTEAGCELAQGYLWSRALPQDEWLGPLPKR